MSEGVKGGGVRPQAGLGWGWHENRGGSFSFIYSEKSYSRKKTNAYEINYRLDYIHNNMEESDTHGVFT